MIRILGLGYALLLGFIAAVPLDAKAASRAGDADLNGLLQIDDAALAQQVLFGVSGPNDLSPLALVGGDGALDLKDVLILAQLAAGSHPTVAPPPNAVIVTAPPPTTYASGRTPNPWIDFSVTSGYPSAQKVEGLEIASFSILEGGLVESALGAANATVQSGAASAELMGLNTGGTDDTVTVSVTIELADSAGVSAQSHSDQVALAIAPASCGDGQVSSPESCDDANAIAGDGCDPACQYENPLCGNGTLDLLTPMFDAETLLATAGGPTDLVVVDLNLDGWDDILTADNAAGTVSVHMSQGDFTFVSSSMADVDGDPFDLSISDLNGDAFPDLIVTHPSLDRVNSYLANGDGTFAGPTRNAFLVQDPRRGVAGRFDNAGAEDFAYLNGTAGTADLMRNLECCGGLLEYTLGYPAGVTPTEIVALDFDRANDLDLLIASPGDDSLWLFPNGGAFTQYDPPYALLVDTLVSQTPIDVAVGELDGDNDLLPDIVTADGAAPPYSGFTLFQVRRESQILGPTPIASAPSPTSVALIDANDDTRLDIVSTHLGSSNAIHIAVGDGSAGFSAAQTVPGGFDPWRARGGDFDGDGRVDLALLNGSSDSVSILPNLRLGEVCDDGNRLNGDGCDRYCRKEAGGVCGNGVVDAVDEGCDDGENGDDGDDCLAGCVAAFCGDGVLQTSGGAMEECDEGWLNDDMIANRCREDCTESLCGDGLLDDLFGEACDDGGANSDTLNNACRTDCSLPHCGDGVEDDGETCDDGNLVAGDGCDASCRFEATPALPDTGLEICYDDAGSLDCGLIGAGWPLQDAVIDRPGHDVVPLGASMAIDRITGLVWQRDAPTGIDYQYNAVSYCANLNLGGYDDWRLPEIGELLWLADYSRTSGCYHPSFLTGPCGIYWSATRQPNDFVGRRMALNMASGNITTRDYNSAGDRSYSRCVRESTPALQGDFATYGLATVDETNQMMWQPGDSISVRDWNEALLYCANLDLYGFTDWRLPDYNESHSLVEPNLYAYALREDLFDNSGRYYWTSTTRADVPANAYRIDYDIGAVAAESKLNDHWARCVRDLSGTINANGVLEPGEQCDDGSHCDNGAPCEDKNDCTAVGSFNCQPRDGDGCDNDGLCTGGDCSALCGNGEIDSIDEQCDDGNHHYFDGCDGLCQAEAFAPSILSDTGQTACFADLNETSCQPPDLAGGGQDGFYQRRPLDFTNSGSIALDNNTGLMWEQTPSKTNIDYYAASASHCANLALDGYDDWRIPNIQELFSITHYDSHWCPTIDTSVFGGTQCDSYWSATPLVSSPKNDYWAVEFANGATWALDIDYSGHRSYTRCVRGGEVDYEGFVDQVEAITATETGLMWQNGEATGLTWSEALDACNALDWAGFQDWRLPDVRELHSLHSLTLLNPALPPSIFGETPSTTWSSTSYALDQGASAYSMPLANGDVNITGKGSLLAARCVRDNLIPVDGNGIVEAGETCDDGNLVGGDGCEPDGSCTGGVCGSLCGDGLFNDATEECEDQNLNPFDGCDDCRLVLIPSVLADTGQTRCYENNAMTACRPPTEWEGGQDAWYRHTPESFTTIGGAVLDNNTGLMWEQTPGVASYEYYSSANGICENLVLEGYDDWRLPNIVELQSIAHYDDIDCPNIDTGVFGGTNCAPYWSRTRYADDPKGFLWALDFNYGTTLTRDFDYSGHRSYIRCVRGAELDYYAFQDQVEVVTAPATQLMWQKGTTDGLDWNQALEHCHALSLAGFDDWRLPNVREIGSLRAMTEANQAVPASIFGQTLPNPTWSSTSYDQNNGSSAYYFRHADGLIGLSSKATLYAARCVRGDLWSVSGDGVVEIGETCDDGNLIDGDGCDANGACTAGDCATLCGDGLFNAAVEQCEDANDNPYDNCDACANVEIPTPLADTGLELCFIAGWVTECRPPNLPEGGQDAFHQRTSPDWTVVGDVVVDGVTGLMWEQSSAQTATRFWNQAVSDCGDLTKGGYNDWRLPSMLELTSIAYYNRYWCPTIDTGAFSGTNCANYWSVDRWADDLIEYRWAFSFNDGSTTVLDYDYSGHRSYVRCVRGADLTYRDYIPGLDTVADRSTQLMWQKSEAALGQSWADALATCNNLALEGYDDWRLPDIRELFTLIAPETINPAVASEHFGYSGNEFWSSTPFAQNDGSSAYSVRFIDGDMRTDADTNLKDVRCVRDTLAFNYADGVLDPGEECDDGQHCVGGTEDGQSCNADDGRGCVNGGGACSAIDGDGCDNDGLCTAGDCSSLCGDGIVNSIEEECDDANANPYDGCDGCLRALIPTVLADTGQQTCYDIGSSVQCRPPNVALGGQDGFYQRSPMDLTVAGASVADANTGLMWEGSAGITSIEYWYDANNYCNGMVQDGYDDWRLPTMMELASIIDYGRLGCPLIDTSIFSGTSCDWHWSSDRSPLSLTDTYRVLNFANGSTGARVYNISSQRSRVRCVRGPQLDGYAEAYQANAGSVTALQTGLIWQKGSGGDMDWSTAVDYCNNLSLEGYDDWKLPDVRELQSLFKTDWSDPAMDVQRFLDGDGTFWSSTSYGLNSGLNAFRVSFTGLGAFSSADKSTLHRVRCVRHDLLAQAGNALLEVGEECDDGNLIDGDGCQSDMTCVDCSALCGDGIMNAATEACDDGNAIPYDGCSTACTIEGIPSQLSDTGLQSCFDNDGVIPCPSPDSPFGGQDAYYERTPFDFSPSGAVVYDNNTGLMWQRDDAGSTVSHFAAGNYCESLTLDAFTGWRLPTYHELLTLLDYGKSATPLIDGVFTGTNSDWYMAESYHNVFFTPWLVHFGTGATSWGASDYQVRCVRGFEYRPQDLRSFGPVAIDKGLGHTWQLAHDGVGRDWVSALDYCNALTLGGYDDWRLPDVREAAMLISTEAINPNIDPVFQSVDNNFYFWTSSSTFASNGSNAWSVDFSEGRIYASAKSNLYRTRCIRSDLVPVANNGILDAGEACDDGMHCDNGIACADEADCLAGGTANCAPRDGDGCQTDGTCTGGDCASLCGDGAVNTLDEACDDGNNDPCDGCAADCSFTEGLCGDGTVDCAESCDDGQWNGQDYSICDANCNFLGCVPQPSTLDHWWPANANSADIAGGLDALSVVGSLNYQSGWNRQAFTYVGTTGAVWLPGQALNGRDRVTIEFWGRTTDSGVATFVSGAGANSTNELLLFSNPGAMDVFIRGGSYSFPYSNAGLTPHDGLWHHFTLIRNVDLITLVIDGKAVGQASVNASPFNVSDNGFVLGQEQDCIGGCLDGSQAVGEGAIDDFSIHNVALNSGQAGRLYQNALLYGQNHRCGPICGNGALEIGETCDDGDLDNCTMACSEFCDGPYAPPCGDGVVECDEICDDGALNDSGEGFCLSTCQGFQTCGDGVANGSESCDDGYLDDCGTCNSDCTATGTPPVCGDGVICPELEICDAGPLVGVQRECNLTCDGICGPVAQWSIGEGDAQFQWAQDVAVDEAGDVVVTGRFNGSIDLGGGPLVSAGGYDLFLAKFDSTGVHLWSMSFGDLDDQFEAEVAVDASGDIAMAGRFNGAIDLGGGALVSAGLSDVFVALFDSAGVHQWSNRYGDAADQVQRGLAIAPNGEVVVGGEFEGTVDFGLGPLVSAGATDLFLMRLDPLGATIWANAYGDLAPQQMGDLALDGSGRIYWAGGFQGTIDFGGGALASQGGEDIFIARLDPAGAHLVSNRFGDAADQFANAIAVPTSGDFVVAGRMDGTVDFGGGPLVGSGGADLFLAGFDSGGAFQFSRSAGDALDQEATDLVIDPAGQIWMGGQAEGDTDFGTGSLASTGAHDIFLAQYGPSGTPQWASVYGDASEQYLDALAVDWSGDVAMAGAFMGTLELGAGPLASVGSWDLLLAQIGPEGAPACNQCGDGALDAGEVCDDGDLDICATTCDAICQGPQHACGDSRVTCGEVCDDGPLNGSGSGFCLADCTGIQP